MPGCPECSQAAGVDGADVRASRFEPVMPVAQGWRWICIHHGTRSTGNDPPQLMTASPKYAPLGTELGALKWRTSVAVPPELTVSALGDTERRGGPPDSWVTDVAQDWLVPLTFCTASRCLVSSGLLPINRPKLTLTGSIVNGVVAAPPRSIRPPPRAIGSSSGFPLSGLSTGRLAELTSADLI